MGYEEYSDSLTGSLSSNLSYIKYIPALHTYTKELLTPCLNDLNFLSWSFEASKPETKIDFTKGYFFDFETIRNTILDKSKDSELFQNNRPLFTLRTFGYNEKNYEDKNVKVLHQIVDIMITNTVTFAACCAKSDKKQEIKVEDMAAYLQMVYDINISDKL